MCNKRFLLYYTAWFSLRGRKGPIRTCVKVMLFPCRCYTFAEMPWYQRRVARMLFAAPPSSTYEEVA